MLTYEITQGENWNHRAYTSEYSRNSLEISLKKAWVSSPTVRKTEAGSYGIEWAEYVSYYELSFSNDANFCLILPY